MKSTLRLCCLLLVVSGLASVTASASAAIFPSEELEGILNTIQSDVASVETAATPSLWLTPDNQIMVANSNGPGAILQFRKLSGVFCSDLVTADRDTLVLEDSRIVQGGWFRWQLAGEAGSRSRFSREVFFKPDWQVPAVDYHIRESGWRDTRVVSSQTAVPPDQQLLVRVNQYSLEHKSLGVAYFPLRDQKEVQILLAPFVGYVEFAVRLNVAGSYSSWQLLPATRCLPGLLPCYQELADIISGQETITPIMTAELPLRIVKEYDTASILLAFQEIPDSYLVERRCDGSDFFEEIAGEYTTLGFRDTTVVPGVSYEYRIKTDLSDGTLLSDVYSTVLDLPVIKGLIVSKRSDHEVHLSWNAVTAADGVLLEEMRTDYDPEQRIELSSGTYTVIDTLAPETTSYSFADVSIRSRCYWKLTPLLKGYRGSPLTTPPVNTEWESPEIDPAYDLFAGGRIEFEVYPNCDNFDQITIERKTGTEWEQVGILDLPNRVFTDVIPEDVLSCTYRAKASNRYNTSYSQPLLVKNEFKLVPPLHLACNLIDLDRLALSWQSNATNENFVTAYRVYKRADSQLDYQPVDSVAAGTFDLVDSTVTAGQQIEYAIQSLSGSRVSRLSRPVAFQVPDPSGEMLLIAGGVGWRGGTGSDINSDEGPAGRVQISTFLLGRNEVTVQQYLDFCSSTGKEFPPDPGFPGLGDYLKSYPDAAIVNVSWYDAVEYCNWLSEISGFKPAYTDLGASVPNSNGYRLPTEAEFEFAIRGPENSENWINDQHDVYHPNLFHTSMDANGDPHDYTILRAPESIMSSQSVPLNLVGNVWEWVQDWYCADYYYRSRKTKDPKGPSTGELRIRKGGGYDWSARLMRVSFRLPTRPGYRFQDTGFRVARSISDETASIAVQQ